MIKFFLELAGWLVLMGAALALEVFFVWRPRIQRWEQIDRGEIKRKPISDLGLLIRAIVITGLLGWVLFRIISAKLN
jgi:hypothetical protein